MLAGAPGIGEVAVRRVSVKPNGSRASSGVLFICACQPMASLRSALVRIENPGVSESSWAFLDADLAVFGQFHVVASKAEFHALFALVPAVDLKKVRSPFAVFSCFIAVGF
jgi:hypothetical protein